MSYALLLASGAAGLVLGVAWMRELSLVFGASFEALSIVLATLLAGLAAGAFGFGRWSHRFARPQRVYGLLLIGVAAHALALPLLLDLADALYRSVALRASGAEAWLNVARAVLAFAVLLPPTFCMGGTLPLLVAGKRLSALYALATFGAAIGTLLAGFVLLPELGVRRTELTAALASLLIGAAAIALDRTPSAAGDRAAPATEGAGWPLRLAFWGTAVAGMASLALGVVWSRAIALSTGAGAYDFTVLLAIYLSGIALGSLLHAQVANRRFGVPVRSGVTLTAIGVTGALAGFLIPRLPEIAPGLLVLAPCILMGIAFPLAGEARARLDPRIARSVGDLAALNTIGAILGFLLAGFVAIPRLGLPRTLLLASAACLGWGLLVLCAAFGAQHRERRGLAWAGALAALPIAAGIALALPGWDNDGARTRLLFVEEGRGSTVSVIGDEHSLSLRVDGRVVATSLLDDVQPQVLLGHLPMLLHPQPRSALVIGLGAGLTLGGVAADETVERIVVVEEERALLDAAQLFAGLHDDALADLRLELVWQDGRNHLATTDERFDVITADATFTTEYYGVLADHLSPGGIACQRLPLRELGEDELRSAIASFASSFPHATLWHSAGEALLVGSNAPIDVDFDALEARLRNPRVSRQLARVGLDDPLNLLAEFAMDRAALEHFSEGATLATDDNLLLELRAPFAAAPENAVNRLRIDAQQAAPGVVIRSAGSRFASKRELEERLGSFRAARSVLIREGAPSNEASGSATEAELTALAEHYREVLEREPDYRQAKLRLAASLASLGELRLKRGEAGAASALFHEALEIDPGDAVANLQVGLEWSKRQPERALEHFERSIERAPLSVDGQLAAAQALMQLKKFWQAIEYLYVAEALQPDFVEVQRLSCICLRGMAHPDAAVEKCREAQRLAPDDIQIAIELAYTLQMVGEHREAVDTLRGALAMEPRRLAVRLRLAWLLSTSPDPEARNGAEAVGLVSAVAQRAQNPRILDVLAAALAEAGRFEQAADAAARAARLADAGRQPGLAERIRAREAVYRTGQPFREN
jgi:spermidine synthase